MTTEELLGHLREAVHNDWKRDARRDRIRLSFHGGCALCPIEVVARRLGIVTGNLIGEAQRLGLRDEDTVLIAAAADEFTDDAIDSTALPTAGHLTFREQRAAMRAQLNEICV